jgi:flagellar hook-associated protein 1
MSTLGSVMNSALKSMNANQLALSVASNNIANAQTPEFTRQRLIIAPSGSSGDVLGIGTGVDIVRVDALRDGLIEARLSQENSARSGDEALAKSLSDIEALFTDTEDTGLLLTLTRLFNSFGTVALDPASMNFREQLKTNAQTLIDGLHTRNANLANIKNVANKAITSAVEQINILTNHIAAVTGEINLQEVEHTANDLRDQRASLVKQLSQLVEVTELESNGDYQLSTKDNHLLVLNTYVQPLVTTDVTSAIGKGQLASHVAIRDEYVPKYADALNQMTYEIVQKVNTIHAASYNLDGGNGLNFFAPLASATDAAALISLSTDVAASARKIAASTLSTGNDNRAALQLANLLHDSVFTGGTVTDQYQNIVFGIGSDVSNAEASLREHDAMVAQLQNRRQAISGVSIDEESIQILQFQRAYEASARLVRTVDELLQVALGMGA